MLATVISPRKVQTAMETLRRPRARRVVYPLLVCWGAAAIAFAQEQKKPPETSPAPKTAPAAPAKVPATPFPPNEVDLKAAYCRPVVAATLSELQRILSANVAPDLQRAAQQRYDAAMDRTRRLAFYLLPRLNTLQSTDLLDAQSRGYTDVASLAELARTCDVKCGGIADAAASTACRQGCNSDSEAARRARECDDVSWLPRKDF